jgi:hypothetical protein
MAGLNDHVERKLHAPIRRGRRFTCDLVLHAVLHIREDAGPVRSSAQGEVQAHLRIS